MALYEDSVDPEIDLVTREAFINMALKRKIFCMYFTKKKKAFVFDGFIFRQLYKWFFFFEYFFSLIKKAFVSDRLIGGLSRKDGDLNNVSPSDLFDLLERAWETQRPSIMEQV